MGPDSCTYSKFTGQINNCTNGCSELYAFLTCYSSTVCVVCVCVCILLGLICSLPMRLGLSVTAGGLEPSLCLSLKHIHMHTMKATGLVVSSLLDSFSAKMSISHLQVWCCLFRIWAVLQDGRENTYSLLCPQSPAQSMACSECLLKVCWMTESSNQGPRKTGQRTSF